MGLDDFGYPAAALANRILIGLESFGDSTTDLEESWFDWLQYNPFDVEVARKLAELYEKRLDALDPLTDAAKLQQIERKRNLAIKRLERYHPSNFGG